MCPVLNKPRACNALRRKQREAKKVSKEVQAERRKEKAQSKKNSISQVDKLRKQRQRSGFAGDLDMDAELVKMDRQTKSPAGQRISGGTVASKKCISAH